MIKQLIFILILIILYYIYNSNERIEKLKDYNFVKKEYTTYDNISKNYIYPINIMEHNINIKFLSYLRIFLNKIKNIYNDKNIISNSYIILINNIIDIMNINDKKLKIKLNKIISTNSKNNIIKIIFEINIIYYNIKKLPILIEYNLENNKIIRLNYDYYDNFGFLNGFIKKNKIINY